MRKTNYKYFVIAEILAVASFALNTINIISAKEGHGELAPVWIVEFGFIYWLKTILAILGLVYAFKSRIQWKIKLISLVYFSTMIILWYSIPVTNAFLAGNIGGLYRFLRHMPSPFDYQDRIIIQLIWSFPVLIILGDLFRRGANIVFNRGQHA